ncbi:hypothetical protein F5Y13DRAFT_155138 [Hypoxylon sp. FL1857]|nr:hypothetical protein F5Y13DRAFT_155138 [Hypoxylon sp. FL1857]
MSLSPLSPASPASPASPSSPESLESESPMGLPPAPPTSPTRKRVIESSSDEWDEEDEGPSPSKISRIRSSGQLSEALYRQIVDLQMDSPTLAHESYAQNMPEIIVTGASDQADSEPPSLPRWLRALPQGLDLLSAQASLPDLHRILQNVKASILTPEDATEFQKREDMKLAILTTKALLNKFAATEEQIKQLREQTVLLAEEEEQEQGESYSGYQGWQGEDDDVSDEDLAAQVRSILAEASRALENTQRIADEMVASNDGGVLDALEWWKVLREHAS